jgi:fumarylacetoacetate (FAA) hydrolase
MKLLSYDLGQGPRCGVVRDDAVLDVTALLGTAHTLRDVHAVLELDGALAEVRRAVEDGALAPSVPLPGLRMRAPVLRPPTLRDFMVYEEHATAQGTKERAEAWYRMPVFYFSNTLRIFGPNDTVPYPSTTQQLDYELEIACVIGREGRDVREADAFEHVAGFCIMNDWSARDLQVDESTVGLGPAKGKDAATSLGPWLVTADELAPQLRDGMLELHCAIRTNGCAWLEDGDAGAAYHTFGAMIERASRDSRIVPGDVLGSGTVGGGSIGEAIRKGVPGARYLAPGDVVELCVDGLGVLRSTVGPRGPCPDGYRFAAPGPAPVPARGSAAGYRHVRARRSS